MTTDHRAALAKIKRFDQLIAYLRDEMGWPIARDSFEDVDDLFYDFTADELGIDPKTAAKIESIKRLRPLSTLQPWGIFFIKFEPKRLPVVALRRILSQVALKKRASANSAERSAWSPDDLLFVSAYGEGDERQISFAHFSQGESKIDLPTLKVLGWDSRDTPLHLDAVARELTELAGSAAFEARDYIAARGFWERLLGALPAGSPLASSVKGSVAEATQLAGDAPPAVAGGAVSGQVDIAPALAARIAAGDTLFVFARAAQGPRMPLAVLRVPVPALPFSFRLDDTMAMSPALKISAFAQVVVGARISHSGNATPQSGDLMGQGDAVTPGADGLRIVIDRLQP